MIYFYASQSNTDLLHGDFYNDLLHTAMNAQAAFTASLQTIPERRSLQSGNLYTEEIEL